MNPCSVICGYDVIRQTSSVLIVTVSDATTPSISQGYINDIYKQWPMDRGKQVRKEKP